MEFLILTPPVVTPAEPPSGAFLLAAGLSGWGAEAGLLDLSLEFFSDLFKDAGDPQKVALAYIQHGRSGYDPVVHRSQAGHLHGYVSRFDERYPGWKLTLMDVSPPGQIHCPDHLLTVFDNDEGPFRHIYRTVLVPALLALKPKHVLVSVAYLSQLPAAVDLVRFLKSRGITPMVGGSLINSLSTTGHGFDAVAAVLPGLMVGDGRNLVNTHGAPLLTKLSYPKIVSDKPYFSRRPIVPFALSSGCFWNRCLFCPDREMPYYTIPETAIAQFVSSIPNEVMDKGVVLHLLDSAIPPGGLRRYLSVVKGADLCFFGFARPTRQLLKDGLLEKAAEGGCLMLQLGVEGGSKRLLDRFEKGIDPVESETIVRAAAKLGIRTYLYLLFGLPGESNADLQATYDFVVKNSDVCDFLNLSLFNLPRYCELMERRDEFGIDVLDFDGGEGIRLYRPFVSGNVDHRANARVFLKGLRANPLVRGAVLRTPRWFRASHLALMDIPGRKRIAKAAEGSCR